MTEAGSRDLEDRYGLGRRRRIDRRLAWIVVALLLALGLAVLFFGNWRTTSSIEFRDLSYEVIDERTASVTFEVSAKPGSAIVCTLEALSPSYAQAGWKVVELEPSDERTRRFTDTLVTTVPATTAIAKNCWVQ